MIQNTTEDCEAMVIYQLILQNKLNFRQAVALSKDLERRVINQLCNSTCLLSWTMLVRTGLRSYRGLTKCSQAN